MTGGSEGGSWSQWEEDRGLTRPRPSVRGGGVSRSTVVFPVEVVSAFAHTRSGSAPCAQGGPATWDRATLRKGNSQPG
jgi:hypothetical protein